MKTKSAMEAASAINEEAGSISPSFLQVAKEQSSQERLDQGSNLSMAHIDAMSNTDMQHVSALQYSLHQKQI